MTDILNRVELHNPEQARAVLKNHTLPWVGEQLKQGRPLVAEFRLLDDDNTPKQHMTQKPLALMRELVGLFSDVGDVVLDHFMGSGTTGVACLMQARSFIGIERESKYFDIACRRIEQAYNQRPLFEAAPQAKPEQMGLIA